MSRHVAPQWKLFENPPIIVSIAAIIGVSIAKKILNELLSLIKLAEEIDEMRVTDAPSVIVRDLDCLYAFLL